jgi:hypothetical protein
VTFQGHIYLSPLFAADAIAALDQVSQKHPAAPQHLSSPAQLANQPLQAPARCPRLSRLSLQQVNQLSGLGLGEPADPGLGVELDTQEGHHPRRRLAFAVVQLEAESAK